MPYFWTIIIKTCINCQHELQSTYLPKILIFLFPPGVQCVLDWLLLKHSAKTMKSSEKDDISSLHFLFQFFCWWYWMLYNCERKRSMKSGTFCSLLEIRYFQTLYWKKWLQSTAFLLQSRTITQTIDLLSYLFTEKDIKTHCSNTLDQGYSSEST